MNAVAHRRLRELLTGRFRWVAVLAAGVVLYLADLLTLRRTGDVILLPSLVLVGAAVVPVTFTVFIQTRTRDHGPSFTAVLVAAVVGGVLGTAAAATLETETIRTFGSLPTVLIGLIEESAKLVVPALVLLWRPRRLIDGLVLGVAVGSGFAALETMGYGFVETVSRAGALNPVTDLLITRSALAPGGHAAWTGIACVALYAVRGSRRPVLAWLRFLAVFAGCVALHTAWDAIGTRTGFIAVGAASFVLLMAVTWLVNRLTPNEPALHLVPFVTDTPAHATGAGERSTA